MATSSSPTPAGAVDVRRLRSAIEFALLIVSEGRKTQPGLKYPAALDRYTKMERVPNASLNAVRRVLDDDTDFRRRLGAVVTDDLVDEVGRLWLQRPAGWETAIVDAAAAAAAAEDEADLAAKLKRAEKRKQAAERRAARHAADIAGRDQRIEELETQLRTEREQKEALRAELAEAEAARAEARTEARHARDKAQAAERRLERERAERNDEGGASGSGTGSSASPPAEQPSPIGHQMARDADREVLAALAIELASVSHRLAELGGLGTNQVDGTGHPPGDARPDGSRPTGRRRRERLTMPPGVLSGSIEGVRYLLGSGAAILVDGYNVTKLAWPGLSLAAQRDRLIDGVEQLAARQRADVTIVFDGKDLVGAHAGRRRRVRLLYSSSDEIADDVIRSEVERLPPERPVVVVTNDREIIDDVEAMGANVVTSSGFIDALA